MTETTGALRRIKPQMLLWIALALLALAVIVALLVAALRQERPAGLLPPLSSPTAVPAVITGEPALVSFSALNDDPFAYRDQAIQVTGSYTPLPAPDCLRYTGPLFRWALVAENLQLDARGFEGVTRLVAPGTELTVQGVWRLYNGPRGCGKGPARGAAWYLEVTRIVQPNPLVDVHGRPIPLPGIAPQPTAEDFPTGDAAGATPTPLDTPDPANTPTATPTATATPDLTSTATATLTGSETPTLTTTPGATPDLTRTATPAVAATPTPGGAPGTPAVTPTPGGAPPATLTAVPLPPITTATPGGGYPGPGPTPENTPTPDSYP